MHGSRFSAGFRAGSRPPAAWLLLLGVLALVRGMNDPYCGGVDPDGNALGPGDNTCSEGDANNGICDVSEPPDYHKGPFGYGEYVSEFDACGQGTDCNDCTTSAPTPAPTKAPTKTPTKAPTKTPTKTTSGPWDFYLTLRSLVPLRLHW